MPTRSLIQIAIRLFSIYYCVQSIASLFAIIPMVMAFSQQLSAGPRFPMTVAAPFGATSLLYLLFATLLWVMAPWLSSKVLANPNEQVDFRALTREDLYLAAFVFLGLYFCLSSISGFVEAANKFLEINLALPEGSPDRGALIWPLISKGLPLGCGLACLLGAKNFTRKLIRREKRSEEQIRP